MGPLRRGGAHRTLHGPLPAPCHTLLAADDRFELHSEPSTGVVAWRPRNVPADEMRARMSGAFASLTQLDGETWLRSVCVNPYADAERLIAAAAAAVAQPRS